MACARPVIALDFGGPAEIADAEVGALLPMENPEQVTADLARTLHDIGRDPAAWQRRGQAARRRVEQQYSWPAKITAADAVYREITTEGSPACTPA
jgi:glycosyltransferase involved in cell wall biosynthesis